jgi:hypothetical protein
MSILPDEPNPPKPEHRNEDRPPLDLANVLRQVNAIQEKLRKEREVQQTNLLLSKTARKG